MIHARFLALVLITFFVAAESSAVVDLKALGIAALCTQQKSCVSQVSEYQKQLVSTCEIEVKTLQCEKIGEQNPEAKPLLKRCDFKSQCEENAAYLLAEEIACVRGYKNALIDSGVALKDMAVSIGQFVEKNWENLKQNVRLHENFIRQCDQSLACKRDLIKDDSRFNKISDEELQKISASFLYVQSRDMRAYTSSLARASSDSLRKNGMSLAEEQHSKLQDMMNIAKEKMQEEYKKYSCYTSLAKTEMSCYAFGNVVDPTLVFGAAFKGARLAAATGKLAEAAKAEEAVRTGDSIVAKVSQVRNRFLTREVLTKEFLSYSPTTVAENERWIALAEKGVDPHLRYLDVENSQLKSLNDVLKDKNLVTSLTNYHKKLLFDKIESLKKDFPNLNIEQYSDYKSSRFVFGGDIPKELEQKLQQIFKETNQEFSDYLKSEHILRDSDLSNDWFRAGLGQSAEQANVAARYSRQEVQNEVQNYSQEKLTSSLTQKLNAIEKDRQSLHSEVASTSMVEGSTFHEDVFDIVRKNMGNDQKISQAIQQRFALSRLPDETVRRLQSYVKATDEFSPGVFIPRREVANLNEAPMGGFTADVIGLGASNLKGTSEALARSKNLDQVLVEARQAEQSVTKQFIEQKKYFEDAVKKSVDSGKLKTICSGDDCVAIAVKPLSETDKKNILRNLADSPYSGKFRLAFVSEGVRDPLVRNTLSTHGESVEKLLRSALGTVMEPRKLKGLTFGLDMRTQNLNSGSVKLLIGEASEVRLTTQERNLIQKKFAEALQEFNQDFANKGVASSYLPY